MENILVILSINKDFFPRFKSFFPGGKRYYFVLREGIKKADIAALMQGQEYDVIPCTSKEYTAKKIRQASRQTFAEAWILCRESTMSVLYFMNFAGAALGKAGKLYLLDIQGNKRAVLKKEINSLYLKWARRRLSAAAYPTYTWLIFALLAILPILFFPITRAWAWAGRKLLKKKPRLCIAKKVISNQSFTLAKGLKELGYSVVTVDLVGHPFGYDRCDFVCHLTQKNKYLRFFLLSAIYFYFLIRYDLFLFSINGETFFKSPYGINWQISTTFMKVEFFLYRLMGKKFIIQVRDCTCYREDAGREWREMCNYCSEKRAKLLCRYSDYKYSLELAIANADKILFSTADLKHHLPPGSEWLPNAIICEPLPPPKPEGCIHIIHSSTCPEMKATALLPPIIHRLEKEFAMDFQILAGIPHQTVVEAIKKADIVLGQFRVGSYGNFDIECMMYGKPVIGYINPAFFETYPADLPMVNVDTNRLEESIYENLERLLGDEKAREELGRKSREYVLRIHEYRVVSRKLTAVIDALF